jgi:hypothetical protein
MQSMLREKPRRTQTPLEREAIITARWEILLSPGTLISASIRGARFIRRSTMRVKKAPLTAYREGEEKNPKLGANVQRDASVGGWDFRSTCSGPEVFR